MTPEETTALPDWLENDIALQMLMGADDRFTAIEQLAHDETYNNTEREIIRELMRQTIVDRWKTLKSSTVGRWLDQNTFRTNDGGWGIIGGTKENMTAYTTERIAGMVEYTTLVALSQAWWH